MPDGAEGVVKRSISIAGHRTSISLEGAFWFALGQLAQRRALSIQALVEAIDRERARSNLSSAIRVALLAAACNGELAEPAPPFSDQPPG